MGFGGKFRHSITGAGRTCFDAYGKYHLTGAGLTCLLRGVSDLLANW